MPLTAESIGRLVRAYAGARSYQGLIFWLALSQNVGGIVAGTPYGSGRARMWIAVVAIVCAATVGSYYRWRFGRVDVQRPRHTGGMFEVTLWGLAGAALFILGLFVMLAAIAGARRVGVRPIDLASFVVSASVAISLARSRGEHHAWLIPLLASSALLTTLLVPALQPYRAVGHAAMASALVVTAIQLHRFLVREFTDAQV